MEILICRFLAISADYSSLFNSRKLRRLFLRYKEAEVVYSIQHKKLLELAGKAGAIYRIDGTVLINRDIFEEYLEQFHEKSTLLGKD